MLVCGVLRRNRSLCSRDSHDCVGTRFREKRSFHLSNDAMRFDPLSRGTGFYDLRRLAEKLAPVASRCAVFVRPLFLAGRRHWDLTGNHFPTIPRRNECIVANSSLCHLFALEIISLRWSCGICWLPALNHLACLNRILPSGKHLQGGADGPPRVTKSLHFNRRYSLAAFRCFGWQQNTASSMLFFLRVRHRSFLKRDRHTAALLDTITRSRETSPIGS